MKGIPIVIYLWYIFPIVLFYLCRYIVRRTPITEKFNIKIPDLMIPFLILGIHALSVDSFQKSTLPYLLIMILLIGMGVALCHAYYFGDLQYKRFFKIFWRLVFLLCFLIYILLIIFNFITYI